MVTLADAVPGDEVAIAALCAELDEFYGGDRDARVVEVGVGISRTGVRPWPLRDQYLRCPCGIAVLAR